MNFHPNSTLFFRIIILLNAILWSHTVHSADNEAPPRLWQATSVDGKTTFYLLGATHYGLPTEFGSYFDKVVVPAFKTANTLSYEGAGGREPEARPVCDPNVLDENGKKILAEIREKIADLAVREREFVYQQMLLKGVSVPLSEPQRAMLSRAYVRDLDEFELITKYQSDVIILATNSTDSGTAESSSKPLSPQARGNIAFHLRQIRPEISVSDVDSFYGARRAYCSSGPKRIHFFESQINNQELLTSDSFTAKIPRLEFEFSELITNGKYPPNSINQVFDLDHTFTCQRNKEWMQEMAGINDGGIHFYVLGAAHLFNVDHDSAQCDGMLALITKSGMHVQLLK
ncbi:hypothetical protein [Solimicrobium silvestre]|uniref:TraB family n=1 Tax=Solimicrobium silvestre TaxID=2099400 RepID=A0A2S9GXP9_9BURK|nr:hypothetical protein [Solimicrobium silvestre]PRC92480.1 hypothetical protein S2091_2855 [Solimicrobium silvestre]